MLPTRAHRLASAAVLCCFPALARAADSASPRGTLAVALDYTATRGCPSSEEFRAVVVRRLGYDPFHGGAPDHVIARIEKTPRAVEGHLEWRDDAGKWVGDQRFPSRTNECGDLARAMGFALAVQIQLLAIVSGTGPTAGGAGGQPAVSGNGTAADETGSSGPGKLAEGDRGAAPGRDAPGTGAAPSSEASSDHLEEQPARPTPEKLAETPSSEVTRVAEPPEPSEPATLSVGVGPAIGFGIGPSVLPIGRLFGAIEWTHLTLEIGAEGSSTTSVHRPDGAGFSQRELLGSGAVCGRLAQLRACAVGKAGQIRVVGQDIDVPASPSAFLGQAGVRLALVQPLGRWISIGFHADGLAVLTRWTVTLDKMPVWSAPRFVETLGLDLAVRLF